MKKNNIRMIIAMLLIAPFMMPSFAWARSKEQKQSRYQKQTKHKHLRSSRGREYQHKKRVQRRARQVRHQRYYRQRPRHVTRHHRVLHKARRVRYQHVHLGYRQPCYDPYHVHGTHWDVSIGNRGWGFGVHVD